MKRVFVLVLSVMLVAAASLALAAGNVTIAVNGLDGFTGNISGIQVWGERVLLSASGISLYTYDPQTNELAEVEGNVTMDSLLDADEDILNTLGLETGGDISFTENIFAVDDTLYRLALIGSGEESTCALVQMRIADDGSVSLGDAIDLGDQLITEYGGGYYATRMMQGACGVEGKIYALSYGDGAMELLQIDPQSGDVQTMDIAVDGDVQSMCPYKAGQLLIVMADNDQQDPEYSLLAYDPAVQETSDLGTLPGMPVGVAYDEAREKIYYAQDGSVWRTSVSGGALGEAERFGDMPLQIYSANSSGLVGDLYIIGGYDGVVGRDVTAVLGEQTTLQVMNNNYTAAVRSAYYPFTDQHPEYVVNISNGTGSEDILTAMMNRDSGVDIYTMSAMDEQFGALIDRGYLPELDSQKLRQAVSEMYPAIADEVMRDGKLYAVPLECSNATSKSINMKLLQESFGLDMPVPTSWTELLGLIQTLSQGLMEDVPEATVFEPIYSRDLARELTFSQMMLDFFMWMDQSEENMARAGEMLITLCTAFEAVDWDCLGLAEEVDMNAGWVYDPEHIILGQAGLGMSAVEQYQQPMLLSIADGEEPLMGAIVGVAFVNPFSEHHEAAQEYLEYALDNVQQSYRMAMIPALNEPVESSYYKYGIQAIDDSIAQLEKAMQESEDEEKREQLAANLEESRAWREEYEANYRYEISAASIERYREFAEHMAVAHAGIWSNGNTEQIQQYLGGEISKEQLAAQLQKVMQMMKLEAE